MSALQENVKSPNFIARDITSPAVKMGNRSLFPEAAVPPAFFCTPLFRHRKKSVSVPCAPAPESARQPPLGTASSKVDVHRYKHEAFLRTAIT